MFHGERIEKLLNGMSWQELANKSGISRSHLYRLKNNQKTPNSSTVTKIAEALGVKEDSFYKDNVDVSSEEDKVYYYELADRAFEDKVPLELIKAVVEGWQRSQKE